MKKLMKEGISLTNYFGHTHPSQPNYIASVGGDYFGMNHDDYVTIPRNVSTVVDLFDTKNIEWKGYFEGLPGPGYMGAGSTAFDGAGWDYVRKHKCVIFNALAICDILGENPGVILTFAVHSYLTIALIAMERGLRKSRALQGSRPT
jgi:hypothetical protein